MKPVSFYLVALLLAISLAPTRAQPARGGGLFGGPGGPKLGGSMSKLFGDHKAFSATMESEVPDPTNKARPITMPGQLAFHDGNSRLDMDMSQVRGGPVRPEMAAQLKAMGMGEMSLISRPERKMAFIIYPGLKSYAESPIAEADAATPDKKYKIDITELGKETIDGHPCVRHKVVITDDAGKAQESTVWNAIDLKKFPIRIEQNENAQPVRMTFKKVKFEKPDGALFEPPKEFKRYDSIQAMMQEAMMKRLGGAGAPPAKP